MLDKRMFKLRHRRVYAKLRRYLRGEAELLEMAANRLNLTNDDDLREMGRELASSSRRLLKVIEEVK